MAWENVLALVKSPKPHGGVNNRRLDIIMGTAVGGLLLVGVVMGCAIVKGEPKVRAAYMARCRRRVSYPTVCVAGPGPATG